MVSVRASRNFRGNGPISLTALSKLEHLPFPVSVRALATVQRRDYSGRVTAGDVDCDYSVTLYSNGAWYITCHVRDDGDILGDSFEIEVTLDSDHRVGRTFHGELGPGDSTTVSDKGVDPWVRENWAQLHGGRVHIEVDPDLSAVVTLLILGGAVVFFLGGGKIVAQRCQDQPADNHDQCVEFVRQPE